MHAQSNPEERAEELHKRLYWPRIPTSILGVSFRAREVSPGVSTLELILGDPEHFCLKKYSYLSGNVII